MEGSGANKPVQHTEGESNTSSARANWIARNTGELSAPLLKRDADAFMHQSLSSPCVNTIAKAEGIWIEDLGWMTMADFLYQQGVAEAFGLTFELPEQLRPIYTSIGIDIPAFNGDDSFVLPVPASYIVDSDGIIRHHFVNVDYTRRLEPDDLLQVLRGQ